MASTTGMLEGKETSSLQRTDKGDKEGVLPSMSVSLRNGTYSVGFLPHKFPLSLFIKFPLVFLLPKKVCLNHIILMVLQHSLVLKSTKQSCLTAE